MTPHPKVPQKPKPSPTNEIGYPQYERTLEHFYLWTSGGSLKDKLSEFAVRYETAESTEERFVFRDQLYDAIVAFFKKQAEDSSETEGVRANKQISSELATPSQDNPDSLDEVLDLYANHVVNWSEGYLSDKGYKVERAKILAQLSTLLKEARKRLAEELLDDYKYMLTHDNVLGKQGLNGYKCAVDDAFNLSDEDRLEELDAQS